jgi:hypothetical protein
MGCAFIEVWAEWLNIVKSSFGFKGLVTICVGGCELD